MKYIFYKIYQFWQLLSFGLSNMEYRAAYTIAGVLLINLYSILKYAALELPNQRNTWGLVFGIIWLLLISQLLLKIYKIDTLNERYQDESILSSILGSFVIVAYILISIYFFIDSLSR